MSTIADTGWTPDPGPGSRSFVGGERKDQAVLNGHSACFAAAAAASRSAGLLDPAAEQLADAGDHAADMLALAAAELIPLARQPQIRPQFVQVRVGGLQVLQALHAAARIGFEDRMLVFARISPGFRRSRRVDSLR